LDHFSKSLKWHKLAREKINVIVNLLMTLPDPLLVGFPCKTSKNMFGVTSLAKDSRLKKNQPFGL